MITTELRRSLRAMLDQADANAQAYDRELAQHRVGLADIRQRELAFWSVPDEWASLVVGEDQEDLSFAAQRVAEMADNTREEDI